MALVTKNVMFGYDAKNLVVKDFNLEIDKDERVALNAPSGIGKTTICKILAGYIKPLQGEVLVDGNPLPHKGICPVQLVQQHPERAVDPRQKMKATLLEAGSIQSDLIEKFGIQDDWLNRFPHELSGGEIQRFCIVRALMANPKYLVADEISTMLDALTQAQIWHALLDEANNRNMGIVFVSHYPALTNRIATRIVDIC